MGSVTLPENKYEKYIFIFKDIICVDSNAKCNHQGAKPLIFHSASISTDVTTNGGTKIQFCCYSPS